MVSSFYISFIYPRKFSRIFQCPLLLVVVFPPLKSSCSLSGLRPAPTLLTLLLCTLNLPVPSCHSLLSETLPRCGILLLVVDCNHLQDCSAWAAVGPAKCILAERRKTCQSHPGTHLHRAGTFGHAANPLPQPQASYCGMVTKHSLADSAQPIRIRPLTPASPLPSYGNDLDAFF